MNETNLRHFLPLSLAALAMAGCSDFATDRVTGVESISAAGAPAGHVDAELRGLLAGHGFTGRIASTLESRLGRPIDRQLANVGRLLWFDPIQGINDDNACAGCHSGAAFSAMIAAGQNFTEVESGDANPTHQDCRTCHQIHTTYTGEDWALETTEPVTQVVSGLTFDGGAGNLCANCHQARRYPADFVDQTDATKYTSTSPRFNPHLSVQSDVLLGSGGLGVEGSPGAHYAMVENTCVGCHLGEGDNHLFEPQLATCQACHADAENYDINGAQTAVEERLAELQTALQAAGLVDEEGTVIPGTWDEAQATALWNYGLIHEDASHGVHNPSYINALLDASFEALGQ